MRTAHILLAVLPQGQAAFIAACTLPPSFCSELFTFNLRHRNGNRKGERIPVQGERLLIGREQDADLRLRTPDVSRKHCVLLRFNDGIHVQDLRSRNGTKVNGVKIDQDQSTRLADRDKLQIGNWKFRCLISESIDRVAEGGGETDEPSEPSQLQTLLDELDTLATTPVFLPSRESVKADLVQPVVSESNEAAETPEMFDAVKHRTSDESERSLKSKPTSSDSPKNAEEASSEKPANEPEAPDGLQKLQELLRQKASVDSSQAADVALRKLFRGG